MKQIWEDFKERWPMAVLGILFVLGTDDGAKVWYTNPDTGSRIHCVYKVR